MNNFLKKKLMFIAQMIFVLNLLSFVFAEEMTVTQKRLALVEEVKKYIGTPYVYGGESLEGIDCSGLIMVTARDIAGVLLPRKAAEIYSYVRKVENNQKQSGDLVFFKTVGSSISHVGVYIGKNQFIHAVSDGANTGVIVSSLEQNYWKQRYVGAGTYFPAGYDELTKNNSKKKQDNFVKVISDRDELLLQAKSRFPLDLSVSGTFDWNFFTADSLLFVPRGFSIKAKIEVNRWKVKPGFAVDFRDEIAMGFFLIPLTISVAPTDFLSIYGGCVFKIGNGHLVGSEKEVKNTIFPCTIGLSLQTPAIQFGKKCGLRFVQDFSYTFYNRSDNLYLSLADSLSAGFVLQSGLKFDIYLPKSSSSKKAKS